MSVPTIPVFGPIVFPRHPIANITPFTYRDGETFLRRVERLEEYIRGLIVELDADFAIILEAFRDALDQITEENNETIAEFNALFEAFQDEVQLQIDSLNNLAGQIRNASAYGATGDGVTDDTPFIQAAVNACPDGGTVIVEPGTYVIATGPVIISGKSLTIDLTNAIISQKNDAEAFSFRGTLEAPLDASNITVVTTTGDETTRDGVQITLSAPVTWQRGDVVKLVADDVLPGSRTDGAAVPPAERNRVGQFLTVQAMNGPGTVVTLMGTLRDPFTVNPRIARLLPVTGHLIGGDFRVHPDFVGFDFNAGVIQMLNLINPTIRGTQVSRAGSQAFGMGSCYQYNISDVVVNYARNTPGTALGYAINDNCSEFGKLTDSHFVQVRHAFTSGANAIEPDEVLSAYGRTYGTIISACTSQGSQQSSFDTHLDADNVTFLGCIAVDSPTAFNLRGRNHNVIGCTAKNVNFGVNMSDEQLGFNYGHTVNGFTAHGVVLGIRVQSRQSGHPLADVRDTRPVYIRNVNLEQVTGFGMHLFNATVIASDIRASWVGVMPNKGFQLANSHLLADDISCDFTDTLTGNLMVGIFGLNGDATHISRLTVNSVRVTAGSIFPSRVQYIVSIDELDVAHLVQIDRLMIPLEPGLGICTESEIAGYIEWAISAGNNQNSAQYAALSDADLVVAEKLGVIRRTHSGRFVLRTTQAANVILATLPTGGTSGQELLIINRGTGTVTVQHGVGPNTNLVGGTAKVLAPNESLRLVYASIWTQTPFA